MQSFFSRRAAIILGLLVVIAAGVFSVFVWYKNSTKVEPPPLIELPTTKYQIIGKSVEGRKIEAYTYGQGTKHLVFVGGIHGGYEWNSVYLAYRFMDYLETNPDFISEDIKVTVIPSMNPDGLYMVTKKDGIFTVADITTNVASTTAGRFNANKVDLNRNFDCKWQSGGKWKGNDVSAGTGPFSEPEAMALRDFTLSEKPQAFVFWHSQAGAVYASQCGSGILPETIGIMDSYSRAAGYAAVRSFDSYVITGAADDWLSTIGIPAISVELTDHNNIEWDKNLAGIKSLFDYYLASSQN